MSSSDQSSVGVVTIDKEEVELSEEQMCLVRWEELALSLEEHYHAHELWLKRPNSYPMGHHR